MKKKIKLTRIIQFVNEFNRTSDCDPKIREGRNSLLEEVLKDANMYHGHDQEFSFGETTRRTYYPHPDLL